MSTPDPYAPQPPPPPYGQPPNPYAPPAYAAPQQYGPLGYPPGPNAYAPPYGFTPNKPTDGVSVAALVTGVLGIWPAALVCGFLGIKRTRSTSPQSGRGFAIAGVILGFIGMLGTIAVVAIVVALATSTTGHNLIGLAKGDRVLVGSLTTGDCFAMPSSASYGVLSSVQVQTCADAHDAEVIAQIELPGNLEYPGQSSLVSLASEECNIAYGDVTSAHPKVHNLRLGILVPNSSAWDNDDHRALCVAEDRNGPRVGSLTSPLIDSTT